MTAELLDKARIGLEAWLRGDVNALAPMLDPEVELLWWEPGEAGLRPATLIIFHGDKVIKMRQFRHREEALAVAR